jgi:tetratricopeptide (TPR) repeat protein
LATIICGALAFSAPFVVYLVTLAPAVTFGDSGELAAAAATLGIPHPSGYPLATLVGALFTFIPFGVIAWKVNLASAFTAAAACAVFYLLLRRMLTAVAPDRRAAAVAALGGALALGFSRTFWGQAVVTEVYALAALVLVAILFCGYSFVRTADPRYAYATCFLAGLASAAHPSLALVTVPLAVYALIAAKRLPTPRAFLLGAVFVALGFGVYLYLPLRALRDPVLDWGDPRTLGRFYDHVTRRVYGGPVWERLAFAPGQWRELALLTWREFTPAGAAAAVAGLIVSFATRRARPWTFFAILGLILGPLTAGALVLLLQIHQLYGIEVWYIPFFVIAAAFLARALFAVASTRGALGRWVGVGAAAAAAVLPATLNFPYNDNRGYYFSYDFGGNLMRTLPYKGWSVVFTEGAQGIFETAYLKMAERRRPDVLNLDAAGVVFRDYGPLSATRPARLDADGAAVWEREFALELMTRSATQPVYYQTFREEVLQYGHALEAEGISYRVYFSPPRDTRPAAVWKRYSFRGVDDFLARPDTARRRADLAARAAISRYYLMRARENFEGGDTAAAATILAVISPVAEGSWDDLAEIANLYLMLGTPREAIRYYDKAAAAFPRQGKGDPAFRLIYARLFANRAVAFLFLGDADGAAASYEESLAAYPNQPDVRRAADRDRLKKAAVEFPKQLR